MFFQYGDCETTYLTSKDKRLGWAIQQIGHINEPVNKSGHEKYYFLNLIFKSRH